MGGTSVQGDAELLAAVVVAGVVLLLLGQVVRLLLPTRPHLPEEDRPPAGLGRLVPVGAQIDQECRRGLVALELWLGASRGRP